MKPFMKMKTDTSAAQSAPSSAVAPEPLRDLRRPATWHTRARAALIHLGMATLVAVAVAAMVFGLWFPGEYRRISGGTDLFILIVGVDLCLGPLITLIIFDRRKPAAELRRDVAIVVALQLAALAYGLHLVSISRPVVVVLEKDRFRVVPASATVENLLGPQSEYRAISLTGPTLMRTALPTDRAKQTSSPDLHGDGIGTRPALWQRWDDAARAEALAHAKPLASLAARHPNQKPALDAAVAKTGRPAAALVYIPMITFGEDWVALLDAAKGDVVGYAPLDGF